MVNLLTVNLISGKLVLTLKNKIQKIDLMCFRYEIVHISIVVRMTSGKIMIFRQIFPDSLLQKQNECEQYLFNQIGK